MSDWTEKDSRCNASDDFLHLSSVVARLIRGAASDLLHGRSEDVGVLIMAQLAHKYHLRPDGKLPEEQ